MKKFIFKIVSKYFKEQIEESFIEEEIKDFKIEKKNALVFEKLSDLYHYPEYRVFAKMISNRAKAIAFQAAKGGEYTEAKYSRISGQIYCTALILKTVKFANKQHQIREKGIKNKLGVRGLNHGGFGKI